MSGVLITPEFQLNFEPLHGTAVSIAKQVVRVTAPNGGPFTFHGTNSYIVGTHTLAVVDPGPLDDTHLEALIAAIDGRAVSHIFITHTHMDHSPLAGRLRELTGARTVAFGPHRSSRVLAAGELNLLDASADTEFVPDHVLAHNEAIATPEWSMRGVFTPGHTANHLAFALEDTGILFSGDHVMAWATTIVAPPDGSMADYLSSLDTLLARSDRVYFPGHGGPVRKPKSFVRALKSHRLMREAAILSRVRAGERTIGAIVASIYKDTDPRLHGAAALTVFAHMERLIASGLVKTEGAADISGNYDPFTA
jgi:glyoxylase-like metal-dependent hydrolase (beta-lactamase superfamily II)